MDFDLVQYLGCICISVLAFQLMRKVLPWVYFHIIAPTFLGPMVDVRQMGAWAVVTGATDGIGKAYAKALAEKGLNLVLISRSLAKLETVAQEIGAATQVQIKIVQIDFTDGPEIFDKIEKQIQDVDIGVLVNNVGISYSRPEYFIDIYQEDPKFLRDIVAANIHSVTHMCALVLPGMLRKNKGVIINLSSGTSVIPSPMVTVYSATKAFVNKFSVELQTEYESKGLLVQSVYPGFVATNMSRIKKTSLFVPSADDYVRSALCTIGISGQTAGYIPHSLLLLGVQTVNAIIGDSMTRKVVLKNFIAIRKRALRKKN